MSNLSDVIAELILYNPRLVFYIIIFYIFFKCGYYITLSLYILISAWRERRK